MVSLATVIYHTLQFFAELKKTAQTSPNKTIRYTFLVKKTKIMA